MEAVIQLEPKTTIRVSRVAAKAVTEEDAGKASKPKDNRQAEAFSDKETGANPGIDWVVAGGESGHGARPMHPDWARSLRDQCAEAGVPFLFKQWGEYLPAIDRDRDDLDWRRDYSHTYADDQPDMAWLNIDGGCGFHGARFHVMQRVGKRVAGRLLDGIEHNAFPTSPQREEA